MAKSKTRLIAEYMRNIQETENGVIKNADVQSIKDSTLSNVYSSTEVDAMFDDVITELEALTIVTGV
jgi:hypothetical protein